MGVAGVIFAIQAGFCAALASVSAKLATSSESSSAVALALMSIVDSVLGIQIKVESEMAIAVRVCGVLGIFVFNAVMWVLFTKSMHLCSSTLEATAFNTASNFLLTAIVGYLLFGEQLGLQWTLGSLLVVAGLIVLHSSSGCKDTDVTNSMGDQQFNADKRNEDKEKLKKTS